MSPASRAVRLAIAVANNSPIRIEGDHVVRIPHPTTSANPARPNAVDVYFYPERYRGDFVVYL